MIYNQREDIYPNKTYGIEVGETIKYLGVTITNMRNCFADYKNECLTREREKKMQTWYA